MHLNTLFLPTFDDKSVVFRQTDVNGKLPRFRKKPSQNNFIYFCFKMYIMKIKITLGLLIFTLAISCQNSEKFDLESETKEVLNAEAKAREYHFKKNVKALIASFSKDFISINKGKIEKPTYDESFKKFDSYFKSVEFIKWDNNMPPIVRFSDDGSIAYVAVDKLVIVKFDDEKGNKVSDTTNFAWLSVFKKQGGRWSLDCIASTNR